MNIVFLSISSIPNTKEQSITMDLLRELKKKGHDLYIVCACDVDSPETSLKVEDGLNVLRVKIGKNKNTNLLRKGATTVLLPCQYKVAIKKYFSDIKFDLVLYSTPPVTHVSTVKFIKRRDKAKSYLLLKDIFPQNAIDIGILSKEGIKSVIYRYFCEKEKQLYDISDCIGCMSPANVEYILKHNPDIDESKVGIFPNSIYPVDKRRNEEEKKKIRKRFGIEQNKTVFIYGGNLGKPQGVPFIIECMKKIRRLDDVIFIIVGKGTEYRSLENYVKTSNQKNLMLMQHLPKDEYDELISACDIGMIFLDHRFTIPNFPSRLLGYLQAGLPVFACTDTSTDIGKVIDTGGFGWWCESNNVDEFYNKVEEIVNAEKKGKGNKAFQYLNTHYNVVNCCEIILDSVGKL